MPLSISHSEARYRLWLIAVIGASLVIVGLVAFHILPLSDQNKNRYISAAFDKQTYVQNLPSTVDQKPILVFGSSTVAFSLSAQQLSAQMQRPVYNLGLQAGLGLSSLALFADSLSPTRDIFVLIPDPAALRATGGVNLPKCDLVFLQKSLPQLLRDPTCLPIIIWRQALDIRYHVRPVETGDSVYLRENFNQWGDMVGHLERQATTLGAQAAIDTSDDDLARYSSGVSAITSGLTRIVLPPPAAKSFCNRHYDQLRTMLDKLHTDLDTTGYQPAPIICIDDAFHFDGAWHLSKAGRTIYSNYVVEQLRERLGPAAPL